MPMDISSIKPASFCEDACPFMDLGFTPQCVSITNKVVIPAQIYCEHEKLCAYIIEKGKQYASSASSG